METGITYTNYVSTEHGEVAFLSLPQRERERIGNTLRKNPLKQFGKVEERPPA